MVKIGGAWKFIWKFSGQKQKEQSCQMGGSCMLRFSGEHPKRKIDILFARSLYRKYWCRRLRGWGSMMVWHVHFDFTHRTKRYPLANTLAIRRLPGCVQVTAFARSMANLCKRWRIVSQSLSTAWRLLGSNHQGFRMVWEGFRPPSSAGHEKAVRSTPCWAKTWILHPKSCDRF